MSDPKFDTKFAQKMSNLVIWRSWQDFPHTIFLSDKKESLNVNFCIFV